MGTKTCRFCKPDNVLMVDDCEWKNVMNENSSCYFMVLSKGETYLSNRQNVIPNICTTLLPFINMDLVHYDFITKFL